MRRLFGEISNFGRHIPSRLLLKCKCSREICLRPAKLGAIPFNFEAGQGILERVFGSFIFFFFSNDVKTIIVSPVPSYVETCTLGKSKNFQSFFEFHFFQITYCYRETSATSYQKLVFERAIISHLFSSRGEGKKERERRLWPWRGIE